ncbi:MULTISPECIES: ABC transporter ATP-binding protein [Actinomycetes]|uniref:ABC transporter ATP-binding protein n=1 Tax=Streptomyces nondiastaticus TaxID=3154512 RepID=A0ABW6U9K5_9ACTN|nr:ATP-binding cassette domain-containing protein [Streptosporangium nondiastaticum]
MATGSGTQGGDAGAVLRLRDVSVSRRSTGAEPLATLSWTVRAGEHWALLGPNGAGKTTLLRLAGAVMFPTTGTVDLLGHRLGTVDVRELRAFVGHVSPAQRVPPHCTAHTVVLTGATGTVQPLWDRYDDATRDRATALLKELGCEALLGRRFGECSQGEQARIRIARALLPEPRLLLLDEPFSGLDLPAREDLVDSLEDLARSRPELATVTVSHHLEELPSSVSHVLLLRDGRPLAQGPVAGTLGSAALSACFGRPIELVRNGARWHARTTRP